MSTGHTGESLGVSPDSPSLIFADIPGSCVSLSVLIAFNSLPFFPGIYLLEQTVFQIVISLTPRLVSLGL